MAGAVSASHMGFGSLRLEPVFMMLGQVVGTVAALAHNNKAGVHDLLYRDLRRQLLANHQILER